MKNKKTQLKMEKKNKLKKVRVIGAGLAGSEAIYFLSKKGFEIEVYENKITNPNSAQHDQNYGELVCSNSLKSTSLENACGLLKQEIEELDSLIIKAAKYSQIPSGQDLAVDRNKFSKYITDTLKNLPNATFINQEYTDIDDNIPTIICTGPLTTNELSNSLTNYLGSDMLSFYDAAAPLVFASSLNMDKLFLKSRYDKGEGKYLNSAMTEEQYDKFYNALINAERAELHDFDHFEGCLPIEVMAKREKNTLKYGPLKIAGLTQGLPFKPAAIVQLRQDDTAKSLYGLVGFQTNLTYKAQKEVFSLIPGLENAKFARFGLMHRNSYICAPKVINRDLSLKRNGNIFIGGQLSGVEGYVESAATGLLSAIYLWRKLENLKFENIPLTTILGSLVNYLIMSSPKSFQPMNATYGILLDRVGLSKMDCYTRSIEEIKKWKMTW